MDALTSLDTYQDTRPTEDTLPAALNAIRAVTKKFEFNHLQGQMEMSRRLRNIEAFEQESASALQQAWECAVRATMPDVILNAALTYYDNALDCYSDAVMDASSNESSDPRLFDQLTARSLELLNEMATWKMLAYQPLERKWITHRLLLLETWLNRKLHRPAIPGITSLRPEVSSEKLPLLNNRLATQALKMCPALSTALVRSMLLELAGAETLTRPEISVLVKAVWKASQHIELHSQLDTAGGFCIDHANGKARRESAGCLAGITLHAEDIRQAMEYLKLRKVDWCNQLSDEARDQMLERLMTHHWSATAKELEQRPVSNPIPVTVHHGYIDVLRMLAHPIEFRHNEYTLNNAQVIEISEKGCAVLMPKWMTSPTFTPGRIIGLSTELLNIRNKFGILAWMKQYEANPQMLHFGIKFFSGTLHPVTMRSERAFPSNLTVETLAEIRLDNNEKLLIVPSAAYQPNLRLENVHNGEVVHLGDILEAGQDFKIVTIESTANQHSAQVDRIFPIANSQARPVTYRTNTSRLH